MLRGHLCDMDCRCHQDQMTVLMYASRGYDSSTVELLLKHGVNVNAQNQVTVPTIVKECVRASVQIYHDCIRSALTSHLPFSPLSGWVDSARVRDKCRQHRFCPDAAREKSKSKLGGRGQSERVDHVYKVFERVQSVWIAPKQPVPFLFLRRTAIQH